jgi:hypothetical protein
MPRIGTADLGTTNLPLSEGDWIEVKSRLNYYEQQRLANASLTTVNVTAASRAAGQTKVDLDMANMAIERIVTWVTDWSFVDANKKRLAVNRPNVEALDPDIADEINAALDAYIDEMEAKKGATIIEIESSKKSTS